MADQKITALTSLAQADIVSGTDVLPIVDVGAPSVTKKGTPKAIVGAAVNDLAQTWNAAGTTFTAIKMNATDTASAAGSLLLDLQVGGVTKGSLSKGGLLVAALGVQGTTTNNSAAAGTVGEEIVSTVIVGSAVSLTTATAATVTSIALTAGDWDVSFDAMFTGDTTTLVVYTKASLSTTDNTMNNSAGFFAGHAVPSTQAIFNSGLTYQTETIGPVRVSLAAPATYYLVAQGSFSVSTMSAWGMLRARRIR
jgi:hypothetical protein